MSLNPINSKADKVRGATPNHYASLDAQGNLLDSGFPAGSGGGSFLPLTGGTLSGPLQIANTNNSGNVFRPDGNGNIQLLGWLGSAGGGSIGFDSNANPYMAGGLTIGSAGLAIQNSGGITFVDNSVQTTAALPLTGGTMTGGSIINMNSGSIFGANGFSMTDTGSGHSLGFSVGSDLVYFNTSAAAQLQLRGNQLSMNDGGGSGGGNVVLDGGRLYLNSPTFLAAYLQSGVDSNSNYVLNIVGAGLTIGGRVLDMNDGSGSGGGTLNMDQGTIHMQGGPINLGGGTIDTGLGNITNVSVLNFSNTVAGTTSNNINGGNGGGNPFIALNGNQLLMNTGSGSGGTLLNMDGGTISAVQTLNMVGGTGSFLNLNTGFLQFDNSISATGNNAGTLTFSGVTTVLGLPGISTPNLNTVLTNGNDAGGNNISNVGTLTLATLNSAQTGNTIDINSLVHLHGFNLSMNDGSGTGGGLLNMDGAQITNADAITLNTSSTAVGIQTNGKGIVMHDGSGSGGGSLNMDAGSIINCPSISGAGVGNLAIVANSTGVISLESTNGPGGGGLAGINLNANTLNMNNGSVSGGGTLNMDNGPIQNASTITSTIGDGVVFSINNGANPVVVGVSGLTKLNTDVLMVTGALADGTYSVGSSGGSITITNGAITAIS